MRTQLPRLRAIAHRLVGDDADDAVQDCLLKAFERFRQLRDQHAGPAWLVRILVNGCRDRRRARARRPREVELDTVGEVELPTVASQPDPAPYSDSLHVDAFGELGTEDVRAVLLRLPELYRTPLVLVHMHEYRAAEVADMLDAPTGTVLARLHRGRKRFERELWDYAEEVGLSDRGPSVVRRPVAGATSSPRHGGE